MAGNNKYSHGDVVKSSKNGKQATVIGIIEAGNDFNTGKVNYAYRIKYDSGLTRTVREDWLDWQSKGEVCETEARIRNEAIAYGYRLRSFGGKYGYYALYDSDGTRVFVTGSICDLEDWWTAHGP